MFAVNHLTRTTAVTFDSSNREELETKTSTESLLEQIRLAMREGCIAPCRVYDMVDEVLDRIAKQVEVLNKVHDFLGEVIRDSLMEDTPRASNIADEVWDAIHKGDKAWKRVVANDRKDA